MAEESRYRQGRIVEFELKGLVMIDETLTFGSHRG